MKLLYIADSVGPVFQSQVVQLLNYYATLEKFEEIVLLVGLQDSSYIKKIVDIDPAIRIEMFRVAPQYPFVYLLSVYSLSRKLKQLGVSKETIVHCRGEYMSGLFSRAQNMNKNLIVDIRGVLLDEVEIYLDVLYKRFKIWHLNTLIKNISECVYTTVSDELKQYCIKNRNILSDRISVNHCIAGKGITYLHDIREKFRRKLGVSDNEILFVFASSSGGKWQKDDVIAMSLAERGYKVLMLTKRYYDHQNIITTFVPQVEVPNYLSAADIGVVLRDDNVVNKVASPIKFSEYLSCGLPVIANRSVKLIEEIVENYACGELVNSLNEVDEKMINRLMSLDRNEISELGKKLFGVETISKNYIKLYESLK